MSQWLSPTDLLPMGMDRTSGSCSSRKGAALWSPSRVVYSDVSYYMPLPWIILTELQALGKTKRMDGFQS